MKTPLTKANKNELKNVLCYGLPYLVFYFVWRILLPVEVYVSTAADLHACIYLNNSCIGQQIDLISRILDILLIVPYLIWLLVPIAVFKAMQAKQIGDMFRGWKQSIKESWRIFSPDMSHKKRIIIGICWLIVLVRIACITLFIRSSDDWLQEVYEYIRENLYSRIQIPSAYSLYLYIALTVGFYFSYLLLLWVWEKRRCEKQEEAGEQG